MEETASFWSKYKRIIGGILGIGLGFYVGSLAPPAGSGMGPASMIFLGTFVCAVVWWMLEFMPDYVTCLLMVSSWVVLKVVPFKTAFGAFADTTVWLLIGALGIGVGVASSGLLNRIALVVMSKFPATFKGMTTALYVAGNIINPLIPSATAKVSIVAPFAKGIGEKLGFENGSEGMGGLFSAAWMSTGVLYPLFLSASFFNYTLVGLLPKDVGAKVTWLSWFSSFWVWGLVVLVLGYFVIQFLYKPKEAKAMDPAFVKDQLAALGPMSKKEKIVAIILTVALLLWITERVHNISSTIVAMVALLLMLAFNIFDRVNFRAKIGWDSIYFIGGILCLASVFPAVGVDKWIGNLVGPMMKPLINNMYLFVIVIPLALFFLRFVLVSQTATLMIFVVLFTPLAQAAGMNPIIPAFIVLASVNLWNVIYQNTTFLAGFYASDGMVKHTQTIKMSVAYAVCNILALLASVPLWKFMGLIK